MEYTSKEVYEYVSKKTNDPIVERKKCRLSWQDFPIYQSDLEFYDKVSPTFEVSEGYAKEFLEKNNDVKDSFEYKDWKLKAKLPTPTLCPEERERQRFSFRNESCLYKNRCNATWKQIISIFSPDKPYEIYSYDFWIWDNWDGCDYCLKKETKMMDAMRTLLIKVPTRARFWVKNENSDYVQLSSFSKNSYMCFFSIEMNGCLYVTWGVKSEACIDCLFCKNSRDCFECIKIDNCFNLFYSENCIDCSNSSYLYNCINCHDCFNCSNLNNKSYCIDNKQYTQEEYLSIIWKQNTHSKSENSLIWCRQQKSENCFWTDIVNSNTCFFVKNTTNSSNIKYTSYENEAKDCYDTFCSSEFCICTITSPFSYWCWFISNMCMYSKNCRYCSNIISCNHCFWCNWLKNKEFCIYNNQYTKEEYNKIVPEIIAQMIRDWERWEYFNPQFSYFGYNETIAMDYYPLTKQEALKMWYKRSDYESPLPHVEKNVNWVDLPKQWCRTIKEKKPEILDKILNYAIICEVSQRPFRITKQEIEFYIKHNIPLPTKHPDVRHQERFARKDPTIMKLIKCDECWEEMLSVHEKWEWKKILCEKCFYK